MGKIRVTTLAIAFAAATVIAVGCTRTDSGEALSNDLYRKVPKEEHERSFPSGHKKGGSTGEGPNCYFDVKANVYWCQYPKPAPQK